MDLLIGPIEETDEDKAEASSNCIATRYIPKTCDTEVSLSFNLN